MATTYTDTNISQLVINKLSKEEYAGITPDPEQLYLLPESIDNKVTQGSTNPVESGAVYNAIRGFNNAFVKSNSNYVTQGDTITLTINVSNIAYYNVGAWLVYGWGQVASVSLMRITHGDTWSCYLDDIISTSDLSVQSITVADNVATVVLAFNHSGNSKFTFNALSTIGINSITVN